MASVVRLGSGDLFAEVKGLMSDMARLEDEAAFGLRRSIIRVKFQNDAKEAENSRIRKAIYEHGLTTAESPHFKEQVAALQSALAQLTA